MSPLTGLGTRGRIAAAALLVSALLATTAIADETSGVRVYEEQLRSKLDQQLPEAREAGFDAGGWFNYALFSYDDALAQRKRTLNQYQLRMWGAYNYQGVHTAYIRGLLQYNHWADHDNPRFARGDEFTERVERAWYQFDLGKMIRNQTGQIPTYGFRVKVGRQWMTIGTALALSMPLDAVKISGEVGDWMLMGFLGKTVRKQPYNIDESTRVDRRQDRCLWGFEARYRGLQNHQPFVYVMRNRDHTTPRPKTEFQKYSYDSTYVGIGSEGVLWRGSRYHVELVGEWGNTYSNGAWLGKDDICAMAFDVRLEHLFDRPCRPKVWFEYIFGSGDGDRAVSAINTEGGNLIGTKDHAFNAFGYRDTGLAFAPRISNIHIYTAGASVMPFPKQELFKRLELGTSVYFYHKAVGGGPLSDPTAINDSSWVGWEWDVFCNWRVTSDLAWTIRYSAFRPGTAFKHGDRSCRQFLYTGISLSF